MTHDKIITPEAAAQLIAEADTLAVGGFVGIGVPEELLAALAERFERTGRPRDLTLLYAAGQGDGAARGLNRLAHEGLLRRVIGGHWGMTPALGRLAAADEIEAYCLPLGVISQLYRVTAGGRPGLVSTIGLGTFVDPRLEGGRLNERADQELVRLLELDGQECLFYPRLPIDVAYLRGTTADPDGNVTFEREALTHDALPIAQAARNSGGIVLVQVERVTTAHHHDPRSVRLPGVLVDGIVVARTPANHMQTFAESYNPAYTGEIRVGARDVPALALDARKVIARRAVQCLRPGALVNLGIGMPEGMVSVANEEGVLDRITLTVEAGGIGGLPAAGLSFGASANAAAIVDQPSQFDFYDGGGLDQAFLGLAEVDRHGNVNVSRFGERLPGAGGFIDITQKTPAVHFLGTFAVGGRTEIADGRLVVRRPGRGTKFVAQVAQITFSAEQALAHGQAVTYITERCVLELTPAGLELTEIAPGLALEHDVLEPMGFRPLLSPSLREMDPAIFREPPLGLGARAPLALEQRLSYDADENVLHVDLDGLRIETSAEAEALAAVLDDRAAEIGHPFTLVANYDNFHLSRRATPSFQAIVERHDGDRGLAAARYATHGLSRRLVAQAFARAGMPQPIHPSLAEARRAAAEPLTPPRRTEQ